LGDRISKLSDPDVKMMVLYSVARLQILTFGLPEKEMPLELESKPFRPVNRSEKSRLLKTI
jgi:hypothetical protein